MGEKFANRKNSLVLHVMNIDQDYGNLLTKLVVSKMDKSKVINFTMPDQLAKATEGNLADGLFHMMRSCIWERPQGSAILLETLSDQIPARDIK
jgi:hypothetical protein